MNYENNFPKKRRQPFASIVLYLREFLPYLICISIIIFLLNSILSIGSIKSGSMEATLRTGDIVIGNRLAYIASEPQAGDILFFHLNETTYCKRVIGVAGDKITFYDGYVYINDKQLDESAYLPEDVETNCTDTFVVPSQCLFVMGDNRQNSTDSRSPYVGFVSRDSILGKAVFRISLDGFGGIYSNLKSE